jgi:hypothetical protein
VQPCRLPTPHAILFKLASILMIGSAGQWLARVTLKSVGLQRGFITVSGSFTYETFSLSLREFQYDAEYLKYVSSVLDKLLVSRSLTGRSFSPFHSVRSGKVNGLEAQNLPYYVNVRQILFSNNPKSCSSIASQFLQLKNRQYVCLSAVLQYLNICFFCSHHWFDVFLLHKGCRFTAQTNSHAS